MESDKPVVIHANLNQAHKNSTSELLLNRTKPEGIESLNASVWLLCSLLIDAHSVNLFEFQQLEIETVFPLPRSLRSKDVINFKEDKQQIYKKVAIAILFL
uniref:Uncharacterized protein n=1 Tax=Glossina palpalis gambiensis TaxID=67801 RepID=A0A1B0B546_9MUSC